MNTHFWVIDSNSEAKNLYVICKGIKACDIK